MRRQFSDPVGIVAAISKKHRSRPQPRQELACKSIVMGLSRRHREPDRQSVRINQRMNLAGQAASGASHRLPSVPSDARAMLMHANDGCVDHLHRNVLSPGECAHDLRPDTSSSPANETIVAGRVGAKVVRQVAPWRPRSQDPEDAIETRRSFTLGTPRGLLGNIDLMAVHSSSESSQRMIRPLRSGA